MTHEPSSYGCVDGDQVMDMLNDVFSNVSLNMDEESSTDPEKYDELLKET